MVSWYGHCTLVSIEQFPSGTFKDSPTHVGEQCRAPRGRFRRHSQTRAWRVEMQNLIVRVVREEEGQDLIEYAMLATLVALVVGVAATTLGTNLNAWYAAMAAKVTTWSAKAA
jgi:pilus assembly protein Flp/PilA